MNIEQLVKKVEDAQTELLKVRKLVCELEAENTRLKIKSLVLPEDAKFDITDEMKVVRVADNLPEPKIENRWIPVTERLPELTENCLVTVKIDNDEPFTSVDQYFSYGFDDWDTDVIAWMPLPEPYKE